MIIKQCHKPPHEQGKSCKINKIVLNHYLIGTAEIVRYWKTGQNGYMLTKHSDGWRFFPIEDIVLGFSLKPCKTLKILCVVYKKKFDDLLPLISDFEEQFQ
jgi:hypothetical protein